MTAWPDPNAPRGEVDAFVKPTKPPTEASALDVAHHALHEVDMLLGKLRDPGGPLGVATPEDIVRVAGVVDAAHGTLHRLAAAR